MDERRMLFRVGLMVFVTLLATAILVGMFGNLSRWISGGYTVYVQFAQAPGVSKDTPVRKSGIRIGKVTAVTMNDDNTGVIVTVDIQDKWKIYTNEICRAQSNLMGDAYLEFVRQGRKGEKSEQVKPLETLNGQSASDPSQIVQNVQSQFNDTINSVRETSQSFRSTSENLQETLQKLNQMLDENREGINTAIKQANGILSDTRTIVGDESTQKNLRAAVQQLPQFIKDTHETVKMLQQAIGSIDRNMQNIEQFTQPLGQKGEMLVNNLEKGTRDLGALVRDMNSLTEKLNSSDGTIGLLINDPQLYQHLARAAKNIDEVTRQLKPIVDDARVFSDKIARHPESLGVRGALEKKAGIK